MNDREKVFTCSYYLKHCPVIAHHYHDGAILFQICKSRSTAQE